MMAFSSWLTVQVVEVGAVIWTPTWSASSDHTPLASDVSSTDRTNRTLNNVNYAFRYTGAIQDVDVEGVSDPRLAQRREREPRLATTINEST